MAARDGWTIDLKCPACGKTGEVRVSENDHPHEPQFRVDWLSKGFKVSKAGKFLSETEFSCVECEMVAE